MPAKRVYNNEVESHEAGGPGQKRSEAGVDVFQFPFLVGLHSDFRILERTLHHRPTHARDHSRQNSPSLHPHAQLYLLSHKGILLPLLIFIYSFIYRMI